MKIKKLLMTQVWRIQQTQGIISIFFWSLTITGVFYIDYIHPLFVNWNLINQNEIFLGTTTLFLIVIVILISMGFIYDKVLSLWNEQATVAYERNPFASKKLAPKEILIFRAYSSMLKEANDYDLSLTFDGWIEDELHNDEILRKEVEKIETIARRFG